MSSTIHVKCSGALYSTLIFELMKHSKSQEGFLLGDIQEVTSHSISDLEICNENTSIIINVSSFIPCSSLSSFYSGGGTIKSEFLKACIGKDWEKVVGWYRYRGSCEEVYLREMKVHQQLKEIMTHTSGNFLLAIVSAIQPAECGTLDFNYRFHIMENDDELVGSSLEIVNMTDTSTSQFLREAHSSSLYDSTGLKSILEKIGNLEPGVAEAENLHQGLVNRLREILPKYATTQEKHYKMIQEVSKLQAFCHSAGLISDYRPQDKETASKSPILLTRSQKNLGSGENFLPHEQCSNADTIKSSNNHFDFVNSEMEREQSKNLSNDSTLLNAKDINENQKQSSSGVSKEKSTTKKSNRTLPSSRNESPKPKSLKGRPRRSSSSSGGGSPIKVDNKDLKKKVVTSDILKPNTPRESKADLVKKPAMRNARKSSPSTTNKKILKSKDERGSESPEY